MAKDILITPASAQIDFSGTSASNISLQVEADGTVVFVGSGGTIFRILNNGSIQFSSGAVGAPGVAFKDDIDTGLFLQADGALGFVAAGAEKVRLTSSALTLQSGVDLTLSANPSADTTAANKAYVDLVPFRVAKAASTAPVTISNPGTAVFDGVTLSSGDILFLKDQATTSQNGLYVFTSSGAALTRATNYDTSAKVVPGSVIFVKSGGTVNGGTIWALSTDGPITLGTTGLTFAEFVSPIGTNTYADYTATNSWTAAQNSSDSSGWRLNTGSASSTAPTVVPNRSATTTGIGAQASGNVSIIASATEIARFSTSAFSLVSNSVPIQLGASSDLILRRSAAATLALGASDAASPIAQTLTVQGVATGTADTAGANFTIAGSVGTGTGAGGSIVFQTAPAGSTASTQNALATALTIATTAITPTLSITDTNSSGYQLKTGAASSTAPTLLPNRASTTTGIGAQASGNLSLIASGTEIARFTTSAITPTVSQTDTNSSGYQLMTGAASSVSPTLLPNRSASTTGIGAQASGNVSIVAAATEIARFTSSSVLLTVSQTDTNSSGYQLVTGATSSTVPTLVPNRAASTTGVGAQASGNVSIILSGAETARWTTSALSILSDSVPIQLGASSDLILRRSAAASLALGAADAASPVAQSLLVQNVVGGTTDTAGANFTIKGSQGTGTGAGGSIIFQTAPAAGSTASTQNALATALTIATTAITPTLSVTDTNSSGYQLKTGAASSTAPTLLPNRSAATTGIGAQASGNVSIVASATEIVRVTSSAVTSFMPMTINPAAAAGTLTISGAGTSGIELGRTDGSSSTPFIDFHSGATAVDYDSRLIAVNGTGSSAGGNLQFDGDSFVAASTSSFSLRGNTAASSTAPTIIPNRGSTTTGIGAQASGNVSIIASATEIARFATTGITTTVSHTDTNASGYQLTTGAASSTAPTLVPNRASSTTGIGAQASGNVSVVISAAEVLRVTGGSIVFFQPHNSATTGGAQIASGATSSTAPTFIPNNSGTTSGIGAQAAGNVSIIAAATETARFTSSAITNFVTQSDTNASGYQLTTGAASSTAPTLVPNRAASTTGIGAQASGNISLILAATETARLTSTAFMLLSNSVPIQLGASSDLILRRSAAANLALGAADASTATAQTLSVQGVVAGTTDTAGANFTIAGSVGTGTGAGGSIVFQTAPAAGFSASTQNALATALTIATTAITPTLSVTDTNSSGYQLKTGAASSTTPTLLPNRAASTTGIGAQASGNVSIIASATEIARFATTAITTTVSYVDTNAAGFQLTTGAASSTSPTLVPNQASTTSGIGAQASGNVSIIAAGTEIARAASTNLRIGVENNFPLRVSRATATNRLIGIYTNDVVRFGIGVDAGAESGSNNGSDYAVARYDDTGAFLSTAFRVLRATGNLTNDVAGSWMVINSAPSSTVPVFAPNKTATTTGIGAQAAGNVSIIASATEIARFTTTAITPTVSQTDTNSSGYQLTTGAASSTAPTLVPNRAASTTGVGAQASGNISLILAATETARLTSTAFMLLSNSVPIQLGASSDLILRRSAAANLALGAADAASPTAQTLSVQGVVAGTTDTAGAAFTISGSVGTGTGAGGSIIFKTAPAAGSTASTQNALATALTIATTAITPSLSVADTNASGYQLTTGAASSTAPTLLPNRAATTTGIGAQASGNVSIIASATEIARFATTGITTTVSHVDTNASGFQLTTGAASSTAPTLLPNKASTTTGIGAQASGNISLIASGTEVIRITSSAVTLQGSATLTLTADPTSSLQATTKQYVDNTKQSIWIPAGAMVPRTTTGAASGSVETTTNKVMIKTLDFDPSTAQYAQFQIQMPKSWNNSTVTAIFVWSHASTSVNFGVVWGLQGLALSDTDAIDTAFGTAQTVTDTGGSTNTLYRSPETSAITIGNTPAQSDVVSFQVYRDATNGSDSIAINARLHGVLLFYTTNAVTDA